MIRTNKSPLQKISYLGVDIYVKRDDLIHKAISGNKFRKLIGNLDIVLDQGFEGIVTFGGAYSNHIYAVSAFAKELGLRSVGIIRGDELDIQKNQTLVFAKKQGMRLEFWTREAYKAKNTVACYIDLKLRFPNFLIIPEGGTNTFSSLGFEELYNELSHQNISHICTPVGTGGTAIGLLSFQKNEKIYGFSAIKNPTELEKQIKESVKNAESFEMMRDYHFGGYGKITAELQDFIRWFETSYDIPLEQIYTAKMFYGIFDMIQNGRFKSSDFIIALHTGGLQGRAQNI